MEWGSITVCNPGTIGADMYLDRGEKGVKVNFDTFLNVALIPYNGPSRKRGCEVGYPYGTRPWSDRGPQKVRSTRTVGCPHTHRQTDGAGLIYR